LWAEWERLKADRSSRRRAGMEAFHQRLRSLQFLDPACGCGNFLVLAYRELRLLEIEVVRELTAGAGRQQLLPIVNVDQFHGLEYSEWPVRIAEVALWLMDHQMNQQASEIFGQPIDRLPLRSSPHIVQNNALRTDWNTILPREKCAFVLGNPPFVGKHLMNGEQGIDMELVWGETDGAGLLDYVTGWYRKAAEYIRDTHIIVGFVSTNSISQGEQVGVLWNSLFQRFGLKIHFAHRTFTWASEARGKAHVHVVIIGFAAFDSVNKRIYDYESEAVTVTPAKNISPYLIEGNDTTLTSRTNPICDVPKMSKGSQPTDNGNLIIEEVDRQQFLAENPGAEKYLRPFLCAEEYLHSVPRWCLWLVDASPSDIRTIPGIKKRLEAVREFRLASKKEATRRGASEPGLFTEIRQPKSRYIVIPRHSSETRRYIPFGYFEPEYIVADSCSSVPDASIFHFGIISSAIHMAWVRQVCGRIKSDFRYSNKIVYNNYPWPVNATDKQRVAVEEKAQAVLAAREPHLPPRGMSTLADLYDPLSMPPELVKAHAELDRAVEKCYRPEPFHSDRERVEHLFSLYEQLTAPLLPVTPKTRGRRSQTAATPPRATRQRTPGLTDQTPSASDI
jgi:hypothetical protein